MIEMLQGQALEPRCLYGFDPGRAGLNFPMLFITLIALGNLTAVLLAYAVVPTSAAEFPLYVRATIDRLLLHFGPASGLLLYPPLARETINLPVPISSIGKFFRGKNRKG